jgi:WhiB family redox-sensing transcriptional regulator
MNRDETWWDYAACANLEPERVDEIFFPRNGHGHRPKWVDERAKRICADCAVRIECLRFAVDHEILAGTYGGMTDHERRHAFHHGTRRTGRIA